MKSIASRTRSTGSWRLRGLALLIAATTCAALVAGCGDADPNRPGATTKTAAAFKPVKQDPNSPITVWVDATRVPAVKAYKKAHPNAKIKMVTYSGGANGSNELQTKVQLFNRTGSGWPDVVWPNIQDIPWATQGKQPFAAPIDQIVDKRILGGYAPGSLDLCKVNGHIYCVRNDLAQNVLWYNEKLMDRFGYEVPTTWEEYAALGERVAKEHKGYLVGTIGDPWTPEIYFWGSQCPASTLDGPRKVTIDLQDEKCKRMAELLDKLAAAGSLAKQTVFDTGFIKNKASKVLMMPGPSWYGQVLFNATFKTPKGQIAAAPPLKFASDDKNYTGAVGGGFWFISSHTKNLKAAADFVTWVTTNTDFVSTTGTYPAYTEATEAWLRKQQADGYFAKDVGPVFKEAAELIWPGWAQATQYSQEAVYAAKVVPALTAGKSLTSQLGAWQTELQNKAKSLGYSVN